MVWTDTPAAKAKPKPKATPTPPAPATGNDEGHPGPTLSLQLTIQQRLVETWLRISNDLLWRNQRFCSALASRNQWSSHARLGNRLRRSRWEAYRAEFNMIVSRNRAGAPKALAGRAARGYPPSEEQ